MGSERLLDRISATGQRWPNSLAVDVPGGRTLTYQELLSEIDRATNRFKELGVRDTARVAILAPATAETLVDILALSELTTVVPLNPAYTREEVRSRLVRSNAATLITREDDTVISDLRGGVTPRTEDANPSTLFLFETSGTTGRPKNVPLSHRNVGAGVANVVTALGLTPADTCLLMMPLFHVHGLIGCALATLVSGGRLILPRGPRAVEAVDSLDTHEPTWYSAAPTVHRAMLARAHIVGHRPRHRLRLIRSCSAQLPRSLQLELRRTFRVPIVSAYGMTEASHQISSTSLDGPAAEGDVGVPIGCDVVIRREDGTVADPGERGEIWIRGENITAGYEPCDATTDALGAVRSGDLGSVDARGRLRLRGRTKELINKGGEKISPAEIDAALGKIPGVLEAAAFALPDDRLGEDVAAAIIAQSGSMLTAEGIRAALGHRLASFKVPSRIYLVDSLPRTPTGKVVRDRLSRSFSVPTPEPVRSPSLPSPWSVEEALVELWKEVLRVDQVTLDQDFFELGGDSLSAADLVLRASERLGNEPTLTSFFAAPTISGMAATIRAQGVAPRSAIRALVALRPEGTELPLFLAHGASFSVDHYRPLTRHLQPGIPVFGVQEDLFRSPPYVPEDLPALARHYAEVLRAQQPRGPYRLGGASSAGIIALEIARVLRAEGEEVERLFLIDASPTWLRGTATWARYRFRMLRRLSPRRALRWIGSSARGSLGRRGQRAAALRGDFGESIASRVARLSGNLEDIVRAFRPSTLDVPALAVVTSESQVLWGDEGLHWGRVTPNLEKVVVAGTHYGVLDEPAVVEVGAALSAQLGAEPSYESPRHATIVPRDDADSAPSMSHQRVGRRV